MKLQYICQWDEVKEKTWSGTTYSLYKALNKKVDLIDYTISFNKCEQVLMRLSKLTIVNGKILPSNQFSFLIDVIKQQKLKNCDQNINSLQIGCYGKCSNTYIYEDLSASALEYVYYSNQRSFINSNFSKSSIKSIERKVRRQNQIYKMSKAVFTMSHWVADIIKESAGIDHVYCVGGGINLDVEKVNFSQKEGNKFLFVGRDFKRKGGELVVSAFKKLQEQYPELELYIAGTKNPYKEVFPNVFWLGDLSQEELIEYFNKCDVFCLPSEFEAYGLVFPEALCFGMPCIGRNHCEMPYFIKEGENGYLLKHPDESELLVLMKKAIFNTEMRQFVKQHHSIYLEEYSWDAVAKRIVNRL